MVTKFLLFVQQYPTHKRSMCILPVAQRSYWCNLLWLVTRSLGNKGFGHVRIMETHEVYVWQWCQNITQEWESRTKGEIQIDLLWVSLLTKFKKILQFVLICEVNVWIWIYVLLADVYILVLISGTYGPPSMAKGDRPPVPGGQIASLPPGSQQRPPMQNGPHMVPPQAQPQYGAPPRWLPHIIWKFEGLSVMRHNTCLFWNLIHCIMPMHLKFNFV